MQTNNIVKQTKINKTVRVQQLESIFDMKPQDITSVNYEINMPLNEKKWNIGLIVGPSGSGKSTILTEYFKEYKQQSFSWNKSNAIIDDFPASMGIVEITNLLSSVGFSSPPIWLRPYNILSNGEKFRAQMARTMAECGDKLAIDEFTSVIDRTVAKSASVSLSKCVRKLDKQIILASCHYDIEEWLQPDWVYKTNDYTFTWRCLRRRPTFDIKIMRVHTDAWRLFHQYHYLTGGINKSAQCFVVMLNDIPVSFHSYLNFPHNKIKRAKRGHRAVTLPDYQGLGLGKTLGEVIGSAIKAVGYRYFVRSAHPSVLHIGAQSSNWKCVSPPSLSFRKLASKARGVYTKTMATHLFRRVATYEYVGPKMEITSALRLLKI